MVRDDSRQVKDLWVINSIADPRPTLETYKYHMPGEKEAPRVSSSSLTWKKRRS